MLLAGVLLLDACGSTNINNLVPDRRPDYHGSKVTNSLEVPPDLTSSSLSDTLTVPSTGGSTSLSAYRQEVQAGPSDGTPRKVAEVPKGMHIEQSGDRRWLVVDESPDKLWPRIKEFWTSNGFSLTQDDPRAGIMATGWLENRADIPSGPIRDVLKKFLDFAYSAPTRDKFVVRLQRTKDGTEVYLTHYGMKEASLTPSGYASTSNTSYTIWEARPRDPELEAEMLSRLMVYLGTSEKRVQAMMAHAQQAPGTPAARVISNQSGQKALLIKAGYDDAWRMVGMALDTDRFTIEDQNRAKGRYVVEFHNVDQSKSSSSSGGLLSKLAFWRSDNSTNDQPPGKRLQVRLAGQGSQTLVVIHNMQDQPDDSADAQLVLNTLHKAFR